MVLVDFTKEELEEIKIAIGDKNVNAGDHIDDLYEKIDKYCKQESFVYFGNEMLDEEGSKSFLEHLEREPTQKELDDAKEAVEFARKIKVYTEGYCFKCEQEKKCNYFRDVCEECY